MDENKSAGITLKQVNFIKTLCKRHNEEEPNFDEMSMDDAKAAISRFLDNADKEPAPKDNFKEAEKEYHETNDLLRQILAAVSK